MAITDCSPDDALCSLGDLCQLNPIFCGSVESGGGIQSTANAGRGVGQQTIIINNQIGLVLDGLQAISDAISSSAQSAANAAADIAKQTTSLIGDAMKNLASLIGDGVKAALEALASKIGDIVSGVAGALKDIFKTLLDNIGTILKDIKDTIVPLIEKVANVVDAVAKQIQTINDTILVPIANTINGIINTISTLTVAIEKDLHDGLSGILQIPSDIANGLGSLDATLQRTVEQLGKINQTAVTAGIKDGTAQTIGAPLSSINDTLKIPPSGQPVVTTFTDTVKLTEPAGAAQIEDAFKKLLSFLGVDKTTGHFSVGQAFEATLHQYKDAPGLFQWAFRLLMDGAMFLTEIAAMAEPLEELASETARRQLPVTKLSVGDALQAWRRAFISDASLTDELSALGFNDSRQKVMRDLTIFLAPIELATQWYRRGFIGLDDLSNNLKEHGLDAAQIQVLIEDSDRIMPIEQAVTLWRRQLIDTPSLSRVLKENRFSEVEIDAFIQTFELQPDPATELQGDATRIALGELNFATTYNSNPPSELATAARVAGWSDNQLRKFWWSHWNMPGVQHWINLYFRGIRTKTEVYAAMDGLHVPMEIRDDLIEIMRPLIPFRSIPSMLQAGVISEGKAKKYLEAHGFAEETVLALLKFADVKTAVKDAATANKLHDTGLSVAEELFSAGAITDVQYKEILKEHDFTDEAIELTVEAHNLKQAAADRKAVAQGIVDEAAVGLLTYDDAQQQLAQNNFTIAETAHYLRQIHTAKVKASKLPGEGELNHMLQKSVIDGDTYVNALMQQGYTQEWAQRFFTLRTAPTLDGNAP